MRHFIQFVFILMVVLFFATGSSFQSFADSKTPVASDEQKPLTGHVKVKPKPVKKKVLRLLQPDLTIKSAKIFPAVTTPCPPLPWNLISLILLPRVLRMGW